MVHIREVAGSSPAKTTSLDMKLDSAVFYSADLDSVINFYRDRLGFDVEYTQEGKFISFIFENGARLGIKKAVEEREVPGAQTVFVGVTDIGSLYGKLRGGGVEILKELIDQPGFGKNFSILDPDRNKIQFVERSDA